MDQVLQIALESPLPLIEDEVTRPIAPPLTTTTDAPTAHQ
jgi:hypothetical protein